jgi:hypothetical protein
VEPTPAGGTAFGTPDPDARRDRKLAVEVGADDEVEVLTRNVHGALTIEGRALGRTSAMRIPTMKTRTRS